MKKNDPEIVRRTTVGVTGLIAVVACVSLYHAFIVWTADAHDETSPTIVAIAQ